ncbi:MAG: TAXI family TRAP transporter solute-binding subunit [Pseudomonadota bacterium]
MPRLKHAPTIGIARLRATLGLFALLLILVSCSNGADESAQADSSAEQAESADGSTQEQSATSERPGAKQRTIRGKLTSHMLLGTGSVQGVYFPIGGVICRLLNRHKYLHRIRCTLESTSGSIYNLRELREGNFDLIFAQSDWQYHAYNGTSTFKKDGANENLRAVFALEADPLALIVKQDSDVESFDDLQDHVVSFGYARSLQHRVINDLLAVKEWDDSNFKRVRRMSDSKQVGELCADKVEAILLLSSSLTDYLRDLDEDCKLRLVPIVGPEVDKVIAEKPYYRTGKILRGMYLDSPKDVMSFGLGATFVAQESTSPKAIYHVVKEIVENFKDFQSLHPQLKALSKKELPYAGISAPLHPGAIRYYREARLLK